MSLRELDYTYAPLIVAPIVQAISKARKVCDWGCNAGYWLEAFGACGAHELMGFDTLAWSRDASLLARRQYRQVDFEQEIPEEPCDLAVSLENAEHLSELRADLLVDALTKSAPVVLFSAATSGQGGDGHLNEQPHSYWHRKFAVRGHMMHDVLRWAIRDDEQIFPWYRDNLFLYARVPLPIEAWPD